MRIILANLETVIFNGRVEQDTNYDNKPGKRYFLKLDTDSDLGSIGCTKEVYDQVANLPKYSKINIAGDYSTDYRSFKVSAVSVVDK